MTGLTEHIADMKADGPLTDSQFVGNFLIGQIAADQPEDIQFPLSQGYTTDTERHIPLYIGIYLLACYSPLHALDKGGRRTFFIDETVGSGITGHFQKTNILKPGHDDDFLTGIFFF